MRDEELLVLLVKQKQESLSHLVDKYGGLMEYIVRNLGLINDEDVSECISDILYVVWKRINRYDKTKSSFKTWLLIVTRGCTVDYLRKNRKFTKWLSLDNIEEPYTEGSPLDNMIDREVIALLQKLTPPDNEIFYRRFVLGESVAEIANLLQLKPDSIYKRISRGKGKLKSLLEMEGYCYV